MLLSIACAKNVFAHYVSQSSLPIIILTFFEAMEPCLRHLLPMHHFSSPSWGRERVYWVPVGLVFNPVIKQAS